MPQRVLVDANIFFSKTLMDWTFLLRNHTDGMFQLHSTEDVFAETLANMRKKRPLAPGSETRRRIELIRGNIDEIIDDFPGDGEFTGSDKNDYHVHAAALHARTDLILTDNKASDITCTPDKEPYEIITADNFFVLVTDSAPWCLIPIIDKQLAYWARNPAQRQLDHALQRAGCPEFASRVHNGLRKHARSQ